jgi:hypothetical protein
LFREIHRVLVPGGVPMHLYPSKWYLPVEPHIYVPLVNVFWPCCPRWWLSLWARLGIRNEFQQGLRWDRVVDLNDANCETGMSYWSHTRYRRLLGGMFERHEDATAFFMAASYGGVVQLARRLHLPDAVAARISRTFRIAFFVSWKAKEDRYSPADRAGVQARITRSPV